MQRKEANTCVNNIFGFNYAQVLNNMFLMMAWGLFMGALFGLILYLLFGWLEERKGVEE